MEKFGNVEVLINDEKDNTLVFPLIRQQILQHPHETIVLSVSAASNVTSKLTDLGKINKIVSKTSNIVE